MHTKELAIFRRNWYGGIMGDICENMEKTCMVVRLTAARDAVSRHPSGWSVGSVSSVPVCLILWPSGSIRQYITGRTIVALERVAVGEN
ncbi:MAG: hypothetical protein A3K19_17435 [Lentisphaerae bacterium RIFOXYB12_FULL_65_16]|nr:MAG: hypothetical protein A3K18_09005 [Lentisphaerae bacterium RIFOXYA12_64_32]OGV85647.1 MAG: hypothetical protein A3K19_17435 [Lentisphaerae bacterium RIFOXYB12_FULL_65_16]